MNTKTEKALSYFNDGQYRESFSILSTFKIGFSKEERRVIQIAKECLTGNCSFYEQIGIDTESTIKEAKCIVERKYAATNQM